MRSVDDWQSMMRQNASQVPASILLLLLVEIDSTRWCCYHGVSCSMGAHAAALLALRQFHILHELHLLRRPYR